MWSTVTLSTGSPFVCAASCTSMRTAPEVPVGSVNIRGPVDALSSTVNIRLRVTRPGLEVRARKGFLDFSRQTEVSYVTESMVFQRR